MYGDDGASALVARVLNFFSSSSSSSSFPRLHVYVAYNDEEGRCIITHLFANKICNIPKT